MISTRTHSPKRFSSSRGRYANPYFRTKRADRFAASKTSSLLSRISPRGWFYLVLSLAVIAGLIWLTGYASVFVVKYVEVEGVINHAPLEIETIAWRQTEYRRGLIFSQHQLFMYNSDAAAEAIREAYAFQTVKVIKKLPATLIVRIEERTPAAVWFESDQYYLVDEDGWVVTEALGPSESLPTVYNNGTQKIFDKQVDSSGTVIKAGREVATLLPEEIPSLTLKQILVDDERETLKVVVMPNVLIYFSTENSISAQVNRLDLLLASELKDRLGRLSYIDLRYGDKVYFK